MLRSNYQASEREMLCCRLSFKQGVGHAVKNYGDRLPLRQATQGAGATRGATRQAQAHPHIAAFRASAPDLLADRADIRCGGKLRGPKPCKIPGTRRRSV